MFPNLIKGWQDNLGVIDNIKIGKGETKDLGDIFESTHTFYCIGTIKHVSGKPYDFYIDLPYNKNVFFKNSSAATNTFTHYVEYTRSDYEKKVGNYVFVYHLTGPSITGGAQVTIPIPPGKDTVYTTIEY